METTSKKTAPIKLTNYSEELTPESRYGLYVLDSDKQPHRIAETSERGIGLALVVLAGEREEGEEAPVIGVLDRETRVWITGLWHKKGVG